MRGAPTSWRVAGRELLAAPPRLTCWRAPTDNDRGGWPEAVTATWRSWGLDRLGVRTVSCSLFRTDARAAVVAVEQVLGAVARAAIFRALLMWTFTGDGIVSVRTELEPLREGLPPLPRIGLRLDLPRTFDRLVWYGRGPGDSNPDRQAGTRFGRWTSTVDREHVGWIRPQEHGHHGNCRWFAVHDARGWGLVAVGDHLFGSSALGYTPEELTAKDHDQQLVRHPATVSHLDNRQHGIGTASCGPRPMEQYHLLAQPMAFVFDLVPFEGQAEDPGTAARR